MMWFVLRLAVGVWVTPKSAGAAPSPIFGAWGYEYLLLNVESNLGWGSPPCEVNESDNVKNPARKVRRGRNSL